MYSFKFQVDACIWYAPEHNVDSIGAGFVKQNGPENVWAVIGLAESDFHWTKTYVVSDSFVNQQNSKITLNEVLELKTKFITKHE